MILRCFLLVLVLTQHQEVSAFSSHASPLQRYSQRQKLGSVLLASSVAPSSETTPSNSTQLIIVPRDKDNNKNKNEENESSKSWRQKRQFRTFLRGLSKKIYNKRTLANRMDDELKNMEIRQYHINFHKDTRLQFRYPKSIEYRGDSIEPDVSCYAMVANAYARAGLGRTGAELAEQVLDRCDEFSKNQRPNTILKTACLNAWIHADEWSMADYWIKQMEEQYQETGLEMDAPDAITYTQYLEGLAASQKLTGKEINKRSDAIMEKMKSGDNDFARPNRFTYISAMKCRARLLSDADDKNDDITDEHVKCSGMEYVKNVESLLRELEGIYNETGDTNLDPNAFCYVPVANAAAKCRGGIEAARHAESLMWELLEKFKRTNEYDHKPIDGMYTAVFTAYARVDPEDAEVASQRVRILLKEINDNLDRHRPTNHVYTAVINALVIDPSPGNLKDAETILKRMPVDSVAYQCLIKAYARGGYPEKATELLWELQDYSSRDDRRYRKVDPPDVVTISSCANAWIASINAPKDPRTELRRAEELLDLITETYKQQGNHKRHIDHWVFENVIHRWSISKLPEAGEHADKWIDVMLDLSESFSDRFEPTFNTYTLALDAWATSGHKDAGQSAIALLERMQGKGMELNCRVLSSALVSITKMRNGVGVAFAYKIFQRILDLYEKGDRTTRLNARTTTSVLSALAKSKEKEAVDWSMELLRRLGDLKEQGLSSFELNTYSYNSVLNLFAKRGLSNRAEDLLKEMQELASRGNPCGPDTVTYSCVCRSYANSNNPNATERVLNILSEVEEKYQDGNANLKPDTFFYNAVLTNLAKAAVNDESAAAKAHDILMKMELSSVSDNPVTPDIVSYCSVCQAYAVSSIPEGAVWAADLLQKAEGLAAKGSLPYPDGIFYSSIALALARGKIPNIAMAEDLVHQMEDFDKEGRRNIRPNTVTYNGLLDAWAHSRFPDKLEKAISLLEKMKSGHRESRPNTVSYNWVILAAAHSNFGTVEHIKECFHTALDIFRELHDESNSLRPNAFTYLYFLKACDNLCPPSEERVKLMKKCFELCKDGGLISKEVWFEAISVTPDTVKALIAQENISVEEEDEIFPKFSALPREWTRNLPAKARRRNPAAATN